MSSPPLPLSSPPTLGAEAPAMTAATTTTTTTNYAFLVHSQDTLPHNLPPSVDNKPLARQRRRRTSPEDQAILEAEFKQNPKPDKAARQRLVERVALGDKEVQIWFQNRRQTSRRKSKPLEAHELLSSDPASSSGLPGSDHSYGSNNDLVLLSSSPRLASTSTVLPSDSLIQQDLLTASQPPPTQEEIQLDRSFSYGLQTPAAKGKMILSQESLDFLSTQPASSARSVGASEAGDKLDEHPETLPASAPSSSRSLKRTVSSVRLSLASDYTAKISQPDEDSPSPPNTQRTVDMLADRPVRQSLHRSQSAVSPNDSNLLLSGSQRARRTSLAGRSRDSRAWEFWCDRDSRTDLMKKAEQETRGSAADAISLIRTSSKRSALTPLPVEQGPQQVNRPDRRSFKRVKSTHNEPAEEARRERPPLARSQTSVGRLEGQGKKRDSGIGMDIYDEEADVEDVAFKKRPRAFGSPSGDSDKENHDPDNEHILSSSRSHRRSGPKVGRDRPGLGISFTAPLASNRRFNNQAVGRRRVRPEKGSFEASLRDGENADPEDEDEEVTAFMRQPSSASMGARRHHHHSGRGRDDDDMDCVQGLLRLSQGAWR